jgi:hypothetical protein
MNSVKELKQFENHMNSDSMIKMIEKENRVFQVDNVKYVRVNHPKFKDMVMIEKVPSVLKHLKNKKFLNLDKAKMFVNQERAEMMIRNNPILVDYSPII